MKKIYFLCALCANVVIAYATEGALNGKFTINANGDQIVFSKGNLQYNRTTNIWSFMDHQYSTVEHDGQWVEENYADQEIVSLFGWGTGNNPTNTSRDADDYTTFYEWGNNAIYNGGNEANLWRTLTYEEWQYLISERYNYSNLCGRATVNNVQGFVLLPDRWIVPKGLSFSPRTKVDTTNIYTIEQWSRMEAAGAVFLPTAGRRSGTSAGSGKWGYYWSSSRSGTLSGNVSFYESQLGTGADGVFYGFSVRLAQDVPSVPVVEIDKVALTFVSPSYGDPISDDNIIVPDTAKYEVVQCDFRIDDGSEPTEAIYQKYTNYVVNVMIKPSDGYDFPQMDNSPDLEKMTVSVNNKKIKSHNITSCDNGVIIFAIHYTTTDYPGPNATKGALRGRFSINNRGDRVFFSQGNLQYQASTGTWRFPIRQYEYIGDTAGNNTPAENRAAQADWIDLFGWGTGDNPNNVSTDNNDYATYTDWGANVIQNGGDSANAWRTLTTEEWYYLLQRRNNADKLFAFGSVNGVNGIILLPDNWKLPAGASFTASATQGLQWALFEVLNSAGNNFSHNTYTAEQWSVMDAAGAVFLPAAGDRNDTQVEGAGNRGKYWSATSYNTDGGYGLYFDPSNFQMQHIGDKSLGRSVRLVQNVPYAPDVEIDKVALTFVTPSYGDSITNDNVIVPEDAEYEIILHNCYSVDEYELTETEYQQYKDYFVTVLVKPSDGYTFPLNDSRPDLEKMTIRVNNEPVKPQNISSYMNGAISVTIHFRTTGDPIFPPTKGALKGTFIINDNGDKVVFSQGNLQYQGSTEIMRFATNQYDYIGDAPGNTTAAVDRIAQEDWIDLFGWGTGDNPYTTDGNVEHYSIFTDWGTKPIFNGGNVANLWRTLTLDEWHYLVITRPNAATLFGLGSVNGVNGLILLPDDWEQPEGASFAASTTKGLGFYEYGGFYTNPDEDNFSHNSYTAEQWEVMESAGAVFLPAAGVRMETVYNSGSNGNYWSSTPSSDHLEFASYFNFNSRYVQRNEYFRSAGYSVRLVQPVLSDSDSVVEINDEVALTFVAPSYDDPIPSGNIQIPDSAKYKIKQYTYYTADGKEPTETEFLPKTDYYVTVQIWPLDGFGFPQKNNIPDVENMTILVNNEPVELSNVTGYVNGAISINIHFTIGRRPMAFNADGALSGKFTINAEGGQIVFSKGNLQYQASSDTWQFAEKQWNVIGNAAGNNTAIADRATQEAWIDLFGHGTGANPTLAINTDSYYATFTDWGDNPISNGGNEADVWRTLTKDELAYLFFDRQGADTLFALGKVNSVKGLIFLPDNWKLPEGASFNASTKNGLERRGDTYGSENSSYLHNTYTAAQWETMESAGAVFLPAAGCRSNATEVDLVNDGFYWTATSKDAWSAYSLEFYGNILFVQRSSNYSDGRSVRLVQDCPRVPTFVENVQSNSVPCTKLIRNGQLLIEKNGRIYNALGVEVK